MAPEHRNINKHPTDVMIADYLDRLLPPKERSHVEAHLAACDDCLSKTISAYESVKASNKRKARPTGKIDLYMILAFISFALSFAIPRFFLQFLTATLLLGTKWVADSKSTKMLVMIHEAWKNGGGQEASEVIRRLDPNIKSRI